MLVKPRTVAEEIRSILDQKGLTPYQLEKGSGVPRSSLSLILSGKKRATDDILEKIAPFLGASLDRLVALRDADALGVSGLERIRKHAPEALGSIDQLLAELPEDMTYPPTARELKLLSKLDGWEGTELDPRSQSALWMVPPEERWPELKGEAEASGLAMFEKKAK